MKEEACELEEIMVIKQEDKFESIDLNSIVDDLRIALGHIHFLTQHINKLFEMQSDCSAGIKHVNSTLDKRLRRQDYLQELYEKLSKRLYKVEHTVENMVAEQDKRLEFMKALLATKCKQIDLLFEELKEIKEKI